jgi:hypothetical protein
MMRQVTVGDDVWAIGRVSGGGYRLFARMTVAVVGSNPPSSSDYVEYGEYYVQSAPNLVT